MPIKLKITLIAFSDAFIAALAVWLAFSLRLETLVSLSPPVVLTALISIVLILFTFNFFGLYRKFFVFLAGLSFCKY